MKNFKFISVNTFIVLMFSLLLFVSCSNDDQNSTGSAPVITSVSPLSFDPDTNQPTELTSVTQGAPKNYYIIQGSGLSSVQKIYFNDFDTYFNPALVTDNAIVVLIDEKTPYADASNQLKIVTKNGTVYYDFIIAPPSPTINGYGPINASEGDIVTIKGKYFLNPKVTIGGNEVAVISSTLEEIKIKLPAGVNKKYITVSNISGDATAPQAIGTAIYDDVYYGLEWGGPWGAYPVDLAYTTDYYQGKNSIKYTFGGWDGLGMGFTGIDLTPYKAIRIAVKGTKEGTLKLVISGNWGAAYSVPVTTQWNSVTVKLSDIGNPTTFNQLVMQESGGTGGNTILVDDIGFVLK